MSLSQNSTDTPVYARFHEALLPIDIFFFFYHSFVASTPRRAKKNLDEIVTARVRVKSVYTMYKYFDWNTPLLLQVVEDGLKQERI